MRLILATLCFFLLQTPTPKPMPHPAATAAPGGTRSLVWLNTPTNIYHCYGARYYGKTKDGRYMTEAAAKAAGAHAARNQPCGR